MNKEQRAPFLSLAKEINWGLCAFCNFADFTDIGCNECRHPLIETIFPWEDYGEAGTDCWGFRSSMKIDKVQEIVRTIVRKHLDPEQAYYTYDFNEQMELEIKIYGQIMTPIPEVYVR